MPRLEKIPENNSVTQAIPPDGLKITQKRTHTDVCSDYACPDYEYLHHIPSPTSQALMMMKGVEIFLDPDLKQETQWMPPQFANLVCQSSILRHQPRSPEDKHAMVCMVPKNATLLTILMDGSSKVYFCDHIFNSVQDSSPNQIKNQIENQIEHHWWKASAYALETFQFQQVFPANSIFYAWLHHDKSNKINLGIFDISVANHETVHHLKIEQRSRIIHQMFCQAVQNHHEIGNLSWIWVGELGQDEINENNTHTPASGACNVIHHNNWCYEIDYLLKFPPSPNSHPQEGTYNIITATRQEVEQKSDHNDTLHQKKKFKALSVKIP
tara:strand:+ start:21315 stop:22292 length:978 start_codon:yes stop_codon:yes gene_type:complete